MPITTIGSYLITMQEFIVHWGLVNDYLGIVFADDFMLQGGYERAELIAERTALQTAILAVQPADNTRTNSAADRDIKKAAIRPRLVQFRGIVRGLLEGSFYVRSLPTLPDFSVNQSRYLQAFDDMANLWSQINATPPDGFAPPLVLAGGYALAEFTAELAALRAAYVAADNATQNSSIVRDRRDVKLPPIRQRLQQYRKAVVGVLPVGHPLLLSIPAYTPPPGSTPAAVNASGLWNAATQEGILSYTASDNPNLDRYELRYSPGPVYKTSDEQVVASNPPGDLTFETLVGLAAPGASANYRIYVVLTTGNEKGSATVKITRPA